MVPSAMNSSRVMPATAAASLAFSAARNFSMKQSNSFCKAGEATAFFGAWAKAGARCTRAAASPILSKNCMVRLAVVVVGGVVVVAGPAGIEHQEHQPAADQQRKYDATRHRRIH